RYLVRVLAGDTVDDIQHSPAERLDGLIVGEASTADLVHEEARPPHRDLPGSHPLQIAAELCFAQLGLWGQRHRHWQVRVDDLCGFPGAVERTVHDSPYAALSQCLSDRGRLCSPLLAEEEAGKVPVNNPL